MSSSSSTNPRKRAADHPSSAPESKKAMDFSNSDPDLYDGTLEVDGKLFYVLKGMAEKEFTLKYLFENVGKLRKFNDLYSPLEKHFGVKWKIGITKFHKDLGMHLYTNVAANQMISTDLTLKIISKNKEKNHSKSARKAFHRRFYGGYWDKRGLGEFLDWETLENEYLDDGKLEVEVNVKITKMLGFPEEIIKNSTKKMRNFGEEMEQFSDVILKVKEQKFHVSKLYLSTHSTYFAILFIGKFQESKKSEIEMKDIDPQDFQYYLEVLYGYNGIDDDTVEGILSVADMFDTRLIVEKCKEFLVEESELEWKKKSELVENYRLEELKYVYEDVGKLEEDEELDSPIEEYYGVNWKIRIAKNGEHFAMHLYANGTENHKIHADFSIFSKNRKDSHTWSWSKVFEDTNGDWDNWGSPDFIDWKTLEDDYLNNGKLDVEVRVKISKRIELPSAESVLEFMNGINSLLSIVADFQRDISNRK